jgi:hypothetical protein
MRHVDHNVYKVIKVVPTIGQSVTASPTGIQIYKFVVINSSAMTIQQVFVSIKVQSAPHRIHSYVDQIAGIRPHTIALMVSCNAFIGVTAPAIRIILNIAIITRSFAITMNRFVM